MPRARKPARLWLRPAARDAGGRIVEAARFVILDGGKQYRTGCGAGDRAEAERKLAEHIAEKHAPERRERDLARVGVADVIRIYLDDVAVHQARPEKAAERAERLLGFFGAMTLDQITGARCKAYAESRAGKGHTNKGSGGGARRDLQDLAAAINHHAAQGYHRGVVKVSLPGRGERRQAWLTRDEFARLLWTCWRTRETQDGKPTGKRPLRHLCRYLLATLYTGSRPGAWFNAAWDRGPGRAWVDVDGGRFYRQPEGTVPNDKRQPPVALAPGLAAHLRRWRAIDGGRGHVVTFNGEAIQSAKVALARACRLAGLDKGVTAYTMRHSAATWLVAKGFPFAKVARMLGTSEAMIDRNYAHFAPDYLADVALAIGRK